MHSRSAASTPTATLRNHDRERPRFGRSGRASSDAGRFIRTSRSPQRSETFGQRKPPRNASASAVPAIGWWGGGV